MTDLCIDRIARLEKDFSEFFNAVSGLDGFTKRMETMRYGSRPIDILDQIIAIRREIAAEFVLLEHDAEIGRSLRQMIELVKK